MRCGESDFPRRVSQIVVPRSRARRAIPAAFDREQKTWWRGEEMDTVRSGGLQRRRGKCAVSGSSAVATAIQRIPEVAPEIPE